MKIKKEPQTDNMKTFDLYGKCDGCKQQKYANAEFIVQTGT